MLKKFQLLKKVVLKFLLMHDTVHYHIAQED